MSKPNLVRPVDLTLLATRLPAGTGGAVGPLLCSSAPSREVSKLPFPLPASKVAPSLKKLTPPGLRAKIADFMAAQVPEKSAILERYVKSRGLKLTYAATNTEVYTTAFTGAMAGMTASQRIISSINPATYYEQSLAAGVWAQEFDTLWASASAIDEVTAEVILLESYGVWEGRFASSLTAPQAAVTIAAIMASITEAEAWFTSQGITPATWMSGGAGGSRSITLTGLSNVASRSYGIYYADTRGGPVALTIPDGAQDQPLTCEVILGNGLFTLNTQTGDNTLLAPSPQTGSPAYLNQVVLSGLGSSESWQWTTSVPGWV